MKFFTAAVLLATTLVSCKAISSATAGAQCMGKANGQKVATELCNSFLSCNNGAGILQTCEQGKLFNETLGYCDYAVNVQCEETMGAPQGPAPSCHGRNGQMLRNPYDCSSFYFCEHNQALLFYCDAGLYFDSTINNCNWKDNVVCRTDILPTDPDAPDCLGKDWTYFPNYANCATYYRCENDRAVLYSCPEALLFDSQMLTCNWAPSVHCY